MGRDIKKKGKWHKLTSKIEYRKKVVVCQSKQASKLYDHEYNARCYNCRLERPSFYDISEKNNHIILDHIKFWAKIIMRQGIF